MRAAAMHKEVTSFLSLSQNMSPSLPRFKLVPRLVISADDDTERIRRATARHYENQAGIRH